MNNKCPTCGSTYNITPQHVGRTFTCQRCQSALVVQADGLQVVGSPVTQQQPQVPAAPPQPPAGPADAYGDYGGGGDFSRPVKRSGASPMVDFLMFRRMIVPILIHIIFWLMVAASVIGTLVFTISLMQYSALGIIAFPFLLFFTLLYTRILCEMIFLPFRINETLTDILNELKHQH